MALTLIAGRANSGKTGEAYAAVRSAMSEGRRTALLLPSIPDVRRAQQELAPDHPVGLTIAPFDDFLAARWAVAGDGRVPVSHPLRLMLLREAAAQTGIVPEGGRGEGTIDLVARLARQVAEHGTGALAGESTSRAVDLADAIVATVGAYFATLGREGLVEPAEAARALAAQPPPFDVCVANRFVDLRPAQECAVVGWDRSGAEVLVALTWDPAVVATAAAGRLVERLVEAGAEVRMAASRDTSTPPELRRLATELFAAPAPAAPAGATRLLVSQGLEAECALIAQTASAWIAEGMAPERIAVVFRDTSTHHVWMKRALAYEGVPADFDVRVPFLATAIGRAVIDAWDAARPEEVAAGAAPGLIIDWQDLADRTLSSVTSDLSGAADEIALECAAHRQLANALSDPIVSARGAAGVAEALQGLRSATVVLPGPERSGRVQVITAERARARRFDGAIIGGLTSGSFPRRGGGEALESEPLREAARRLGSPQQTGDADRERLLFYLAVTSARRRLALSRQEADDEGSAVRPSAFWEEFLDLYRDPVSGEGEVPDVERMSLADVSIARAEGAAPRRRTGELSDEVRALFADTSPVSASDVEAYLRCPYLWFVERRLRPTEPAQGLDVRTAGVLAHDVLAALYSGLIETHGSPVRVGRDVSADAAREACEQAIADALPRIPTPETLEEEDLRATTIEDVLALVAREEDFLPGYGVAHVEWRFGYDEVVEVGGFAIRGKIDRIDVGPEGLAVIDYKRGSAPRGAELSARGLVQLQLYALAVEQVLGEPVVAGLYRGLHEGKDRGFYLRDAGLEGLTRTDALGSDEFRAVLEDGLTRAEGAVSGMRAGGIAPEPIDGACGRCSWLHVCGGPR